MQAKRLTTTSKALVSICLTGSLIGCATSPPPIKTEVATKINRVAVVSMTAKSFSRQYTGLTVFGNEKEEVDISDWKIDAKYEEYIRSQLKNNSELDVVAAPYAEEEFSRINDPKSAWQALKSNEPNFEAIESATKNYCTNNSLDAVFVVAKARSEDFIAGTNQFFGGAGIYSRGPIDKSANLHLISKVALIDCATAKPIAIRPLTSKQSGMYGDIIRSSPLLSINFEESLIPMQQWSPDQKQRIQSDLSNLPNLALSETLKSILPSKYRY